MNRKREQYQVLKTVLDYFKKLKTSIARGSFSQELQDAVKGMEETIFIMKECITQEEYAQYSEFLESFAEFCSHCGQIDFFIQNQKALQDSLALMEECTAYLIQKREQSLKRCCVCGEEGFFEPLSAYYSEMERKYGTIWHRPETLNKEEYLCPVCGATDRDRLMIEYLKRMELPFAARKEPIKVLQIAPSNAIENWIMERCPNVIYHSTDLYMEEVTFKADIQNMMCVADETYDIIICSHVLEHVQDDMRAMRELKRILRKDGICLFLVPVFLDADSIDEEWGLSEAENWRRFGQGDHSRVYSKQGLMDRMTEAGWYIHNLDINYFGEETFERTGLSDTSTLYLLTKTEESTLELENRLERDWKTGKQEEPLVTVIMSVYNHERFVGKAIESVLNQTYKNIEFIVADDGSSDSSAKILKEYEKQLDEVYYYSENTGGRQEELVLKANGKYTAMMNSDDVWEPDKIEKQVRILEANPKYGACFTWCDYVDENMVKFGGSIFCRKNRTKEEWMRWMFKNGNCLCHPSVLIETPLYQKLLNSGIQAFRQLPDFFMWLKLLQEREIYILPEELVKMRRYRRKNQKNTSEINTENVCRDITEKIYIWYQVIKDMDDRYFKNTFQRYFVYPEAEKEEELLCEKFFLLKNCQTEVHDMAAIMMFFDIYKMDRVKECLSGIYHFGRPEFWDYCGQHGVIQFKGLVW